MNTPLGSAFLKRRPYVRIVLGVPLLSGFYGARPAAVGADVAVSARVGGAKTVRVLSRGGRS